MKKKLGGIRGTSDSNGSNYLFGLYWLYGAGSCQQKEAQAVVDNCIGT